MDDPTPPPERADASASPHAEDARVRHGSETADLAPPRRSPTRTLLAGLDPTEGMRRLLRVDSLVVTAAVVVHLFAGGVAAAVVARGGAEDWWLYLLMSLLTAVVLTNYGRLGARATLARRGFAGCFAILVVVYWAALLADRVAPSWAAGGALGVGEARPELWLAVALEGAVVLLLIGHLVFVAPKARRGRKAVRAARRAASRDAATALAAWEAARAADAAAATEASPADDDATETAATAAGEP
jgi:hypothetical protein